MPPASPPPEQLEGDPEQVDQEGQPPPPDPLARLYMVGVQCIATSLAFFFTAVVKLPVPLYFPLSRRWSVVPNSEELSMDFFGRSLGAIAVGALAGLLTLVVFKVRARFARPAASTQDARTSATAPRSGLTLLTVYAATALVLATGVFGYQLYGRPPAPEPLPPGLSTLQMAKKPTTLPAAPAAKGQSANSRPPAPAEAAETSDSESDL